MQISMKAARINAGLKQGEAAKELNVGVTTLHNWEAGKSAPRADKIPEICRLYKCSVENLKFFYL